MKPPLALFDVAISKLSNDIKNSISVSCANMTLFAWTVTYCVIHFTADSAVCVAASSRLHCNSWCMAHSLLHVCRCVACRMFTGVHGCL